MDTPEKNQITATSLSKFEDSPVFNYINSLSPIEPVKSIHTTNSFNLLSFASPSSLFASPQIGSIRGSRFLLKSHQSPDSLKAVNSLCGIGNKQSEGDSEVVQLSTKCAERVGSLASEISAREVLAEPLNESLGLDFELPKTMKYGHGNPVSKKVSSDVIETSREPEISGASSFLRCNEDDLGETHHFEEKRNLRKIIRIEQSEEIAECNWDSLISDFSAVVDTDSPIVENNPEEQDLKTVELGMVSFISTVLHLPQDNYNNLEKTASTSPSGSYRQSEMREPVNQMEEIGDLKDTDQTPDVLSSTLLNKLVVSDSEVEEDDKGEKCGQSSCKHKIRRRCLFNEMVGSHIKQAAYESNCSSSIQLQSDCEVACVEKQLVPNKRESCYSLPGVGLHLNALATTTKNGNIVKCKTLLSGRQLISMQSSLSSVDSLTSGQNLNEFSVPNSMEKDSVTCDNEVLATEIALQTCSSFDGEDIDHSNPKRKRSKPEPSEESNACKRCNCKRSKCLKLYCDCFAAGLYCVEPCSCLDCFNKPIYEDTVMETRRQIESRNPLAFAPKVIRSIDSATEFGDEINKTPASARHKRGCNCKRSSCLKKYCECFQSGVGCSVSCRCEGCKNAFGRKDGAEETEDEGEEEGCEKNESDTNLISTIVNKDEEEYPVLLKIPSEFSRGKRSGSSLFAVGPSPKLRTSIKLTASDLFYRSKFETNLQAIPEDETPMLLESQSSPNSGVQSASPNSKRILPQHEMGLSTSRHRTRRLTLRSALSFPSVTTPREQ